MLFFVLIFILSFYSIKVSGQNCGPNTPSFTVDLTGEPNGIWISPGIRRDDQCCGASFPDVCVEFWVNLDSTSETIIFDIYSGANPPGALYYQINCSDPTPVGDPFCLLGTGPHRITFCKPGNNPNQYSIISAPIPSPVLYDGNFIASTNPVWYNCIQQVSALDTFQVAFGSPDYIGEYFLNFGDGSSPITGNEWFAGDFIYHTYDSTGTYTVTLTEFGKCGLDSTIYGNH